ncbi:hypothetical protein DBV15_11536 [Temnothorax longispinosus]|uniref:Partial AB-hydrolase lipase domain-containing protein n=1 Tax=Temnothorax longispinosus TaxID=300112 RepID=A0A4S2KL58_9HYME|nr:hypothetical protein DBV15_11536 [Temnothorax longispinosus]
MMTSGMKSMLLAFLIITTFLEERSQGIPLFLQNKFLNFLFPKDPGLVRVRKIDQAERMDSGKVLDFIGLVEQYDYPAEEHNVTTEDGYNLKIHRIPGSPLLDNKKKKEIVFIQHGILASSDSWVLYGPGKDLDLYYVGHSMGGTALFTFLSSRPEYNMKIKMAICLAPASFWMKVSPTLNELITILPTIKEILRERETYDVFPQSLATVTVARTLCNDNAMTQIICVTVLFLIAGPDPAQLNTTTLPDLLSYFPAGSSVQTLEHFYQNIRIKDFRNYDYGIAENYKRYKQKIPPSYDFKKITAPIILFYSANDMVVTKENVLELGKRLPNVLLTEEVPFKHFSHVDFLWAINAKTLLYDHMKFMFLAFLIIMTFSEESEGRLQNISSFLQNEFLNLFFPKDPGLVRVRRMDRVEEMMSGKILDFIGLIERYNYPAEEHNVTTEDGYNLKIHRIPGSPLSDNKKKKEIIFMQHGLLASSDSWVMYGPGKDLAFLLTDQGYDVWIGNVRGNSYCRSHVNMTTYDPKFWQYSFYEIGTKDLPAMFDYILNYTKQKDLYYIGHSMGGTTLLTLLSTKPEYNIKIKMAIGLAPACFWIKVTPIINEIANIYPILMEVLREREIYDFFPQSLATVTVGRMLCKDNTMTQIICVTALFLIVDDFRNYDYGIAENYKRYKQKTPPSYDLKKIIAPIIIFYSTNDMIVTEEVTVTLKKQLIYINQVDFLLFMYLNHLVININALELGKHLPNVLLTEKVPFKLFNHADFVWAINAKTLLYDRVLELIQKFDTDQNKSMK